jgi:hypothetical protein
VWEITKWAVSWVPKNIQLKLSLCLAEYISKMEKDREEIFEKEYINYLRLERILRRIENERQDEREGK